ncbi:sigma-70 family RNA polymerase sigma factor [Pedobacter sp. AW31-3R]|uniref:sigma-70 family RNA polymerase sigma factor n=1 Tax=Pedobacter sp. AW31-3R TaxID=3445781 RepID=UPI003FA007D3
MSSETTVPFTQSGLTVQEYEHIFAAYWKDVFKICHYYTRDDDAAADLTQNVFIMVWQKRNFLKDEGMMKHYLLRAAKLEALNFSRQQQTRAHQMVQFHALSDPSSGSNTTEQDVLQREAGRHLQQQLSKLPLKSQAVFKMSLYDGLDNEAIANELDMGRKNVEYHLYKAIRFIKSKIF